MAKRKNPRRPNFRFSAVGVSVGETLSSKYDASVRCTVVRDDCVKFEGQEMTFTEATKQMFRRVRDPLPQWFPRGLQPSQHWKYQGELLRKIQLRKIPIESHRGVGPESKKSRKMAPEGAEQTSLVTRYERNRSNREKAIKEHGVKCRGCGITLEEMYGEIAKGRIHIHHVKLISAVPEGSQPDIDDLVPLCPNCHAVVHLKRPPLSIDELKALIRKSKKS